MTGRYEKINSIRVNQTKRDDPGSFNETVTLTGRRCTEMEMMDAPVVEQTVSLSKVVYERAEPRSKALAGFNRMGERAEALSMDSRKSKLDGKTACRTLAIGTRRNALTNNIKYPGSFSRASPAASG